jgi:hypothetical protein
MAKESRVLIKKVLAVGESRKQFNDLLTGLREEFKPEGFYENLLVDKIAVDYWRLKKLLSYEKNHILTEDEMGSVLYDKVATQLIAYQKSIEKSIKDELKDLKDTKKEKKLAKF